MNDIVLLVHDIRSCYNVGSLLRTSDCLGVNQVVFSGYTPYPLKNDTDDRLPHIRNKIAKDIHKTALGAEDYIDWSYSNSITSSIQKLRSSGYLIVALEQTSQSISLPSFIPAKKIAILIGREVEGIDEQLLKLCDISVEIPMYGKKESYNVVQAAAIALYHCRTV